MKNAALHLEGVVGEEITTSRVRAYLDTMGSDPVTVEINSPGGIATEGLAVYHLLKAHAGRVTVKVTALAASAASIIAMAGDEIVMLQGALMMIHDPAALSMGPASTHRETADILDLMGDEFAAIYAARTGKDAEEVRSLMIAETWLNGQSAVDMGFADRVAETAAEPAYAKFDFTIYAHAPDFLKGTTMTKPAQAVATADLSIADEIFARCEGAKLTMAETAVVMKAAAGDLTKAKDAIIDALADRDTDPTIRLVDTDRTFSEPVFLAKAIGEAIYCRLSGKTPESGPAREWMGRSYLDMGAAVLQARGEKIVSWNRDRLASQIMASGGQHTTSDFPVIATGAGNRILLDAYQAAESPLKQIARVRNASDFRALTTARLSEMPKLDEVPESAEITYGSRTEAKEAFSIKTYAKMFSISRQALVNDDLGAFGDTLQAFGRAAAETEAGLIANLFLANSGAGPTLDDNKALFHSTRGNKSAAGTSIVVSSLSVARKALRDQKGLDGETPISVSPRYLVVGSGAETEAEQVLAALAAAQVDDVNPFSGKLTLLVEPRLEEYAWRVFADPAQAEVLSIAYLNGNQAPMLETREGWNVLGTEFRAVLDFGCGITGWRGAYFNEGDAPTA